MVEKKTHYKMYKAGKKWMIAGITLCGSILLANGGKLNADQVSSVVSSSVTTSQPVKSSAEQSSALPPSASSKYRGSATNYEASGSSRMRNSVGLNGSQMSSNLSSNENSSTSSLISSRVSSHVNQLKSNLDSNVNPISSQSSSNVNQSNGKQVGQHIDSSEVSIRSSQSSVTSGQPTSPVSSNSTVVSNKSNSASSLSTSSSSQSIVNGSSSNSVESSSSVANKSNSSTTNSSKQVTSSSSLSSISSLSSSDKSSISTTDSLTDKSNASKSNDDLNTPQIDGQVGKLNLPSDQTINSLQPLQVSSSLKNLQTSATQVDPKDLHFGTRSNVVVPTKSWGVDVASPYQPADSSGYVHDGAHFVIVKLTQGTDYINPRAASQLSTAKNAGALALGYSYVTFGGNSNAAVSQANYAIQEAERIGLPKGAYLAADYEQYASGSMSANTAAIEAFMRTVQNAGYRPLLYSGAAYMREYINHDQIVRDFGNCLWVASYPTTGPCYNADFDYFPSMNGIIIWQPTDDWRGLNVDGDINVLPLEGYTGGVPSSTPSTSHSSSNTNHSSDSNEPTWTDSRGVVWHKENGTFTVGSTPVNLRWGATTQSTIITTLQPGQSVDYDAWCDSGGYIWVRQPRGNGTYGYVAVRNAATGEPFGTFSDPDSNNSKPAAQPSKPTTNPDSNYTGQKEVNGKWQYWQNGKPVKNTYEWLPDQKKEVYYGNDGNMVYGQQEINGKWQYFDPTTGAQAKNTYVWLPDQKKEVYYDGQGNMVYGWQTINGHKQYFDPTTGAQYKNTNATIDGKEWHFDNVGDATPVATSSTSGNTKPSAKPNTGSSSTSGTTSSTTPSTSGNTTPSVKPDTGSSSTSGTTSSTTPSTSGGTTPSVKPDTGSSSTTGTTSSTTPSTNGNQTPSAKPNTGSSSTTGTTSSTAPSTNGNQTPSAKPDTGSSSTSGTTSSTTPSTSGNMTPSAKPDTGSSSTSGTTGSTTPSTSGNTTPSAKPDTGSSSTSGTTGSTTPSTSGNTTPSAKPDTGSSSTTSVDTKTTLQPQTAQAHVHAAQALPVSGDFHVSQVQGVQKDMTDSSTIDTPISVGSETQPVFSSVHLNQQGQINQKGELVQTGETLNMLTLLGLTIGMMSLTPIVIKKRK